MRSLVKTGIVALWFLMFTSCCSATLAKSEAPIALENDIGSWLTVSAKVPLWRKWQAYLEVQPRFQRLHESNFSENIIRTGLGYELNKKWSVFGGYYLSSHFDPEYTPEHRLWQQLSYSHKFGRLSLQSRFRCEQSWRENYDGASVRLRNQIKFSYPLGHSEWYLACSDEPFFNLNSKEHGPLAGFAQNRLFLGVGRKINKCTRVEVGYLNQYKNSRSKYPDTVNHVLIAQLLFDFTELKKHGKEESRLANGKPQTHPPASFQLTCVPQVYLPGNNLPPAVFSIERTNKEQQLHPSLANMHIAQRQETRF